MGKPNTTTALKELIEQMKNNAQNLAVLVGANMSGKSQLLVAYQDYYKNDCYLTIQKTVALITANPNGSSLAQYRLDKIVDLLCDISGYSLDKFSSFFDKILPDINSAITNFFFVDFEFDFEEKKLYVTYESRETVFITQTSTGFKQLLSLLILIEFTLHPEFLNLSRYEKITFLIDEIELGLHPEWQTKLLNYVCERFELTYPNISLVYATHSQHMIPIHLLKNIYISSCEGSDICISSIYDDIDRGQSNQNDKTLNVLKPIEDAIGSSFCFTNSSFILVEGEEEMELLKNILKIHEEIPALNRIENLHGGNNVGMYLSLVSRHIETGGLAKGVFMLDSDLDISDLKKDVVNSGYQVIEELKDKFIFVGKELKKFDQLYIKEKTKGFKRIDNSTNNDDVKRECLEDFIIENFYKDNQCQEPYEKIILFILEKLYSFEFRDLPSIDFEPLHSQLNGFAARESLTFKELRKKIRNYIDVNNPHVHNNCTPYNKKQIRKKLEKHIKSELIRSLSNFDTAEVLEKFQGLIEQIKNQLR